MSKQGRRRRGKSGADPGESWRLEHGPLTPMGQVESYGRFARGAFRATGWRGVLARSIVWAILLGFLIGGIIGVVNLIRGMP